MITIPKIFHQIWKNEHIPIQFSHSVDSWKNLHPDWEYVLWTDKKSMKFIEDFYPDFISIYLNYKNDIQRVDALRYLILLKFGGIYVDLDFHCFKNISPLIDNANCILGMEHESHAITHQKQKIISNAIMGSIPEGNFIKMLCNELYEKNDSTSVDKNEMILETTGPFMLTRIYDKFSEKTPFDVKLIEAKYLYPIPKEQITAQLLFDIQQNLIDDDLKEAFAFHYYWGSWWKF